MKNKVRELKKQTYTLYLVYGDKRLPLWKKVFLGIVIGYLFSPIDLIPDFIPIVGYLDDLVLVPIGFFIAFKIIPSTILEEAKIKADATQNKNLPIGYKTSALIIVIWITGLIIFVQYLITIF